MVKILSSLDYLLAVSVGVIIALFLVAFVSNFISETSSGVSASRAAQKMGALGLYDATASFEGEGYLVLANNTGEVINVKSITLDDYYVNKEYLDIIETPPNHKKAFKLIYMPMCATDQTTKLVDVVVEYNDNNRFRYNDVIFDCVLSIIPISNPVEPSKNN